MAYPVRLAQILTRLRNASVQFGSWFLSHTSADPEEGREFSLSAEGIRVMYPVGCLESLVLESMVALILTDSDTSGGERMYSFGGVPYDTLHDKTESGRGLSMQAPIYSLAQPGKILTESARMMERARTWNNPFRNGRVQRVHP